VSETQTGLLKSAVVVGVILGLYAFGYSVYVTHQSDFAEKLNEQQMKDLRRKLGPEDRTLIALEKMQDEQRQLMKENEPLQLATLIPYGVAALLLAAAAHWTRSDPRRAPWLVRAAVLALVARLAVGAVELRLARAIGPQVGKSMQLGMEAAQKHGRAPLPSAMTKGLTAFGSMAESETLATALGWTAALCGYFGWLAFAFWPRILKPNNEVLKP
jgi:hypothetical protein